MKLLLLIMLTTFSFASTQYKTPVFVVENSTLYCLKHLKCKDSEIIKHNPGDLVSGDYAAHNCSYNYETVLKKQSIEIKKINEEIIHIPILILIIFVFMFPVGIIIYFIFEK